MPRLVRIDVVFDLLIEEWETLRTKNRFGNEWRIPVLIEGLSFTFPPAMAL